MDNWYWSRERFWERVDRSGECWIWTGRVNKGGYGVIRVGYPTWQAHRFAWTLLVGDIPPGLFVLHNCDIRYPLGDITYRRCVNPAHLRLGTHLDNMRDVREKHRSPSGDRHWTRLHPERIARGDRSGARTHPESRLYGDRNPTRKYPELFARCRPDFSGERNGRAKLTDDKVREILAIPKPRTATAVAKEYGVSISMIRNIWLRKNWTHVRFDPGEVVDGE